MTNRGSPLTYLTLRADVDGLLTMMPRCKDCRWWEPWDDLP